MEVFIHIPDILDQGCKRDYSVISSLKQLHFAAVFLFLKTMLTDDICRDTI